mgnify:FL=1
MVGLVNAGEDVSSRVIKLVNERTDEMRLHPTQPSNIKLVEKDYAIPASQEVANLKAEIEELKKLLVAQKETVSVAEPPKAVVKEKPTPRKAPASKKTPSKKPAN